MFDGIYAANAAQELPATTVSQFSGIPVHPGEDSAAKQEDDWWRVFNSVVSNTDAIHFIANKRPVSRGRSGGRSRRGSRRGSAEGRMTVAPGLAVVTVLRTCNVLSDCRRRLRITCTRGDIFGAGAHRQGEGRSGVCRLSHLARTLP